MSATIQYKGNTISSINTSTSKTLKTGGKYCDADIIVENVQDGGITPSGTKTITTNGTHDVTNFADANVNVPQGIPVQISTDAAMNALLTSSNAGKAYEFTGTTGTYINGDVYTVSVDGTEFIHFVKEEVSRLLNLNRSTVHLSTVEQTTPAAWAIDTKGMINGFAGYTNTVYGSNCLQSKTKDSVTVYATAGSTGVGFPVQLDTSKSYTLKCNADGSNSRVRIQYYNTSGVFQSTSDVIMHGVSSLEYTFTPSAPIVVFNIYSATNTITTYTNVELVEN